MTKLSAKFFICNTITIVFYILSCRVACSYRRNVIRIEFNCKDNTDHLVFFIITSISRITTEVRDEGIPDCNLGYYDSFDLLIILKLGNSVLDDHFQSFCN